MATSRKRRQDTCEALLDLNLTTCYPLKPVFVILWRCRCGRCDCSKQRLFRTDWRFCSTRAAWPIGLKALKMVRWALSTCRSSYDAGKILSSRSQSLNTLQLPRFWGASTHNNFVYADPAANKKLRVARHKLYRLWRPTRKWSLCKVLLASTWDAPSTTTRCRAFPL